MQKSAEPPAAVQPRWNVAKVDFDMPGMERLDPMQQSLGVCLVLSSGV